MPEPLLVAKSEVDLCLLPQYANRHGLIAGATGTGKTVTLQRVAEGLSRIGVPVFMADVKGDLAGLSQPGDAKGKIKERLSSLKLEIAFEACPVVFWDAFGQQGHPVRTTISEMGPLLLARLLGLNETQSGVLALAFKIADDNGLRLSLRHDPAQDATSEKSRSRGRRRKRTLGPVWSGNVRRVMSRDRHHSSVVTLFRLFSAPSHRPWRRRRPSASRVHCRSGGRSGGRARRPVPID